jgi:drug/metabolite transporter (DMT)-like permease
MAVILAGLSALFFGIADFGGGFAARRSKLLSILLVSQVLGLAIAGLAVAARGSGPPPVPDLLWGFLAGLVGTMGLFMLYGGIARSIVAIVSPTSAVIGALIPVLLGLLLGERPSTTAVIGSALCLPAVLMLTREARGGEHDGRSIKSALVYGGLAGLGFGLFFTAISRVGPGSGLWPLIAARVASLTATIVAMIVLRQRPRLEPGDLPPTLVAGAADMLANIMFMLACRSGLLSLVVIIVSLSPAPTVILARFFLAQRITAVRWAGMVLALAGVGLISVR